MLVENIFLVADDTPYTTVDEIMKTATTNKYSIGRPAIQRGTLMYTFKNVDLIQAHSLVLLGLYINSSIDPCCEPEPPPP